MSFRHDWVLFLLVIQLLFWIFLYFKKDSQRSALSKTNDEVYSFLVRKINLSSIIIKNRLVFLGLFFLTIAASGPQIGTRVRPVERKGVDLVIVLDTSKSMDANDVTPSRLSKAKLELNKLINRRGFNAIRQLVIKGEITDASTIYQLNLSAGQIDRLIKTLEGERGDFTQGTSVIYLTERGDIEDGRVLNETEKFVNLERGRDGVRVKVPKSNIQRPKAVAQARARSRDPSVQRGESVPPAELFTGGDVGESPRPRGTSSEEERPEWTKSARRRDRPARDVRRPRFSEEPEFVGEGAGDLVERYTQNAQRYHSESLPRSQNQTPREFFESLAKQKSAPADLEEALRGAEAASPPAGETTIDELVAGQELSGITEATEEFSGREDAPDTSPEQQQPLTLELAEEEEQPEPAPEEKQARRVAFLESGRGGGSVRKLSADTLQQEVFKLEEGQSKYSIKELDRLINLVDDDDPKKPFLRSSFTTYANRLALLAEQSALQSPRARASAKPLGSGRLGNPKLVRLRKESRERSRSVERELAEPEPQPEPQVGGATGAPMGEIQYAIPTDIKTRLGDRDKFKVVDNRKESARGKGRLRQYPVITLNFSEVKAVIESETKGKQKQNLLRKINEQRDGNRSLFTNNEKILRKIFGA